MSQLEDSILSSFEAAGVDTQVQVSMPLVTWPWKTPRSRVAPKCDIYLPKGNIYIEVKGFMTIYAMAKMAWLCRQDFNYYIFQGTESEWDPWLGSPMDGTKPSIDTEAGKLRAQIAHQVAELGHLIAHDSREISKLSLLRLEDYIRIRMREYAAWNDGWPKL